MITLRYDFLPLMVILRYDFLRKSLRMSGGEEFFRMRSMRKMYRTIMVTFRLAMLAQDERDGRRPSRIHQNVRGRDRIAAAWRMCICACLCFIPSMQAFFDLSLHRASRSYAAKDYAAARQVYEQQLIERPHDSELNFNMADVLYRTHDYAKARDYFERVATSSSAPASVQEKAFFNAGNSYVQLNELPRAIEAYEQALKINPHNEQAVHNRDVVKKMLEQQDKQNQHKQNNQQEQQDKQDQQNQADTNQQQQNDQQPSDRREQQNQQEQQAQQESQDQQKPSEQREQTQQQTDRERNATSNDQNNKERNEHEERDQQQQEENQRHENERQQHEQTYAKNEQTKNQSTQKLGGQQGEKDSSSDTREANSDMMKFLHALDEYDKDQQKKMMQMQVHKGMRGHDGQNNW